MIIHCDNSYIPAVSEFLGNGRILCFYLYMDMIQYGTEHPDMDLWISEDKDGVIRAAFYRYHDTIHMYSRGEYDREEVRQFLRGHPVKVVTMPKADADELADLFEGCECELSNVITARKHMEGRTDLDIRPAGEDDAEAIAALMMKDPLYNTVYTQEALTRQILERLRSGFGRLFVIRQGDSVIATNATTAELEDMAVISGLVTDPERRGQGLGQAITAHTWNLVRREGKMGLAYIACDNRASMSIHERMGYDILGIHARFVRG